MHENPSLYFGNSWQHLHVYIIITLNEICEQITSKRFGTTYYRPVTGYKQSKATTGWWVPTSHKALVPMRAPYQTRLLKCPPVVGAGIEPRLSDQELDPLTTRLTWSQYNVLEDYSRPHQLNRKKIKINRTCERPPKTSKLILSQLLCPPLIHCETWWSLVFASFIRHIKIINLIKIKLCSAPIWWS